MNQRANGEHACPVAGCPTGLQASAAGFLTDGILAHLSVVHGIPIETSRAKFKTYFESLGRRTTS